MDSNEYEKFLEKTDVSTHNPIFYIFGILEEAGEIAGVCKRAMRGDYGSLVRSDAEHGNWGLVFRNKEIRTDLLKEKGDKHWYGTRLLQVIGESWDLVKTMNLTKIKKRLETHTILGKGDAREENIS